MIEDVSEMLQEYFGLTLPNNVIISILEKEPVLKEEISMWGIEDTETKNLIIDSIGNFLIFQFLTQICLKISILSVGHALVIQNIIQLNILYN